MQKLWQDFRFGIRLLLRNPGFAGLAVLVLALGIGANTAIFSLINSMVLRPAPFENPDQLLGCYSRNASLPDSYRDFSYPNYLDLREKNTVFSDLMAHTVAMVGVREGDNTRRGAEKRVGTHLVRCRHRNRACSHGRSTARQPAL